MDSVTRNCARDRGLMLLGGIVLVSVGFWCSAFLSAEETTKSRSSRGIVNPSASRIDEAQLQRKLDDILATQQAILQKFDAVMEELRIIKIRATLRS